MAGGIGGLPSSGPRGRRPPGDLEPEATMTHAGVEPGALVPFPRGRVIRELPVAERPRERLELRGPSGLSSAELVGLLWGSGSRGRSAVDLAEDAIARFEGLTGLARASGLELEAIPGVGGAKAAQLQGALELRRAL